MDITQGKTAPGPKPELHTENLTLSVWWDAKVTLYHELLSQFFDVFTERITRPCEQLTIRNVRKSWLTNATLHVVKATEIVTLIMTGLFLFSF